MTVNPADRFVFLNEIVERTGIGRSKLYARMRTKLWPPMGSVVSHNSGMLESELMRAMALLIADASPQEWHRLCDLIVQERQDRVRRALGESEMKGPDDD